MPYISASIILQLMGTFVPQLEKLKKEGEPGIRKINEWTRYLAVGVCLVQSVMWMSYLQGAQHGSLVYHVVQVDYAKLFFVMGVIALSAGSIFLMWLGEQIDQYGIGNGVSLIITAGIVARMPDAILYVYAHSALSKISETAHRSGWARAIQQVFDMQQSSGNSYNLITIGVLIIAFVVVVAGSIILTQAQRRIRVQQAKHMRGRKVYGGQSQYLPLRVNHAGVMPIIFASSLMMFPSMAANWASPYVFHGAGSGEMAAWRTLLSGLINAFQPGRYLYECLYVAMIFFFSYFWNTVQFQPKEMANQLRDYGSFIPGLRPGKRTADYLENVMGRITYVGAAFLAVIAVVPTLVSNMLLQGTAEDYRISQFLGGTGLLIVIQVMLDLINRIEANLVMRNYGGFLENATTGGKLKDRLRGAGRVPPSTVRPAKSPDSQGTTA